MYSQELQSGRMEAPAETLHKKSMCLVQCCKKSKYLVQVSKSGKYASDKKVALKTLILINVEAPTAWLLKGNLILATFPFSGVF